MIALFYAFIGIVAALLAYFIYAGGNPRRGGLGLDAKPFFLEKEPVFESTPKKSVSVDMSPVSGSCAICGEGTTLPFRCKFCGGLFCADHRLPENHNCSGLR